MTLLVETPPTYEPERRYILAVVLSEWLGVEWQMRPGERSDIRISCPADAEPRCLVLPDGLFATPQASWLQRTSLPATPLAWRTSPATGQSVPILYGPDPPPQELVHQQQDRVGLAVDVLGSCFFELTRYEEIVVPERDAYGRAAATSSIAHRERFLGLPVVDAYVELLWSALRRLWPRLERPSRQFRLRISHDVDDPLASLGRGAGQLVRQLGADALVRRSPGLAARRVRSWAALRRGDHRLDPYNTFEYLMDSSERHGSSSAFYLLATERPAASDGPYTLEHPWIGSLLERIHERGHEIGFHASFDSYRDPARTSEEFLRLRRAAERHGVAQAQWGGRQHFLRWENPTTWCNWEQAGLDYDATLGYADHVGFRAGTCHDYPAFDLRARRRLRLQERPLHVMDGTLFEYMGLGPDAALGAVCSLARECRRYGGVLSLLWHNSFLPAAAQKRFYETLLDAVA